MKKPFVLSLAILAVICVQAISQWQPIEDIFIPEGVSDGHLLFYDRSADYIGVVSGYIRYEKSKIDLHIYDIEERELEFLDSIRGEELPEITWDCYVDEMYAVYSLSPQRLYLFLVWQFNDEWGPRCIQVWELKKDGWESIDIAYDEPLPRRDFSMAISTDGRIMLHGGYYWDDYSRNIYFKQTWIFHHDKWRLIEGDGPVHLRGAALTYDEKNKNFVLFGGETYKKKSRGNWAKHVTNKKTWIFDGIWKRRLVNKRPKGRRDAYMFYNDNMEKVVLYGGYSITLYGSKKDELTDIWTWDGRRWELYDDDTKVDGKVIKGPITFDSRRNRMIALYKNKFWEYKFNKKAK